MSLAKNSIYNSWFKSDLSLVHCLSRKNHLVGFNSGLKTLKINSLDRWMTQQADSAVEFPEGLVRSVFDNEHVIWGTILSLITSFQPVS